MSAADEEPIPDVVEHPIGPELDLHTFRPDEIGSLLPEYFAECRKRGILRVRIIHGKGSGALRIGVHQLLAKWPEIQQFIWPADETSGSWGATWVSLQA
jgi:DNA-nicking Smr family endonuclease